MGAAEHAELLRALGHARAVTDALFGLVLPPDWLERPIPERHRLLFYLGHVDAFDWNLLARGGLDVPAFDEGLDRLFAFGIDPVRGDLPTDAPSDWPPIERLRAYVSRARALLDERLASSEWRAPELASGRLLHVAIEHRLMHAETFTYALHQLPLPFKVAREPERPTELPHEPRAIAIPPGEVTLGQSEEGAFGWDNELEPARAHVPAFTIRSHPVTNGEWLEFVRAGGYEDRHLWTPRDWEWRVRRGLAHPTFWQLQGDSWMWRTMFGLVPLPLSWPAYVSHAEAAAYARWRRGTLPTEAQFHRAAYADAEGNERPYPWGDAPPTSLHGNFGGEHWDPMPVGAHPAGASAFGVEDLVGNGWEWTSTPFQPLPGFRPFPFYRNYSAPFFDGEHYVLKGGSPRTDVRLLRRSFRNWFQPRYPYVYAKLRLVEA